MKNRKKMFRLNFSLVCLFLISFSLYGQEESVSRKIHFGIKAGSTLSSFSSEQPHNNFKPGFTAGGFVSYRLSGSFSLQLEPSYFQQGGNLISITDYPMLIVPDPPFFSEIKDSKITFHNIDVPLLVKFEKKISGLIVFVNAGPSLAYNLGAQTKTDVSARSLDAIPVYFYYHEEENISSNIEKLQYGVTGGLGFETPIGKHSIIFDIKYRYGLNKTYPGYSYLGINQIKGDLQTNSFYCTLGFSF